MTAASWAKLREFHLWVDPAIIYQMREMRWREEATAVLQQMPNRYGYGQAWTAPKPELAGRWTILGYEPGKGSYRGEAEVKGGADGEYRLRGELRYSDRTTESFEGEATLYGGYALRTRTRHGKAETRGAYIVSGAEMKGENHFPAPRFRTSSATWIRKDAGPRVARVSPPFLLAGEKTTVRVEGVALPAVSAADVAFAGGFDSAPAQTVIQQPVLLLSKAVSPTTPIAPNDVLTYTLTLTNDGTGSATNIVVTDAIPANTTYVAGSASPAATLSGGSLRWSIPSLAAQTGMTLTFQVRANTGLGVGTYTITNTASVVSAEITTPVTSNSTNSALVVQPELTLVKTSSSDSPDDATGLVHPLNTITYTIVATNVGTGPVTSVAVTDAIPEGTTYVPGSATWALENPAGASGSVAPISLNRSGISEWTLGENEKSAAAVSASAAEWRACYITRVAVITREHRGGCTRAARGDRNLENC
jgi:uncharacterized repeat protein (TIGR01451 family)